jgi:hypothetical protein
MSVVDANLDVRFQKAIDMTSSSTAILTVSPKHVGAWGDTNLWRISGSAQLVENSIPYWLVTPTQPAEHQVNRDSLTIETPHAETVVESILMLLAAWFGGSRAESLLVETHNLTIEDNTRQIAPYWELSESTQATLASQLATQVRLGVTLLDQPSLIDNRALELLRGHGFEVTVFSAALPVHHL